MSKCRLKYVLLINRKEQKLTVCKLCVKVNATLLCLLFLNFF